MQSHFNPRESNQPGGPLFGVQFSSLACSDVVQPSSAAQLGPKPSPLGLSADPGGLPLYKNGTVVGGIGVIADGLYSVDLNIFDTDTDSDELIAVAGSFGFAAPTDVRADHITVDGRTLRYVDSEATASNPAAAPPLVSPLPGTWVNLPVAGVPFDTSPSGFAPDPESAFMGKNAYTLVDGGFGVHSVDRKMTVAFRGKNLFNRPVQQHVFGDVIRRTVTGEVRFEF